MWPRSWTTRGPMSRYLAGSRSCHTLACSITWSSPEMSLGKSWLLIATPASGSGNPHGTPESDGVSETRAASLWLRAEGLDQHGDVPGDHHGVHADHEHQRVLAELALAGRDQ